jgi:hypothetical protein
MSRIEFEGKKKYILCRKAKNPKKKKSRQSRLGWIFQQGSKEIMVKNLTI